MAKFRAIVNAVRQAITGNATTADVLSGKTFMSSASPNEQTGAMTNNGAVTASLTADGQVYTIPAGYHNGAGTVAANIPAQPINVTCGGAYNYSGTGYLFLYDLKNATYVTGNINSYTTSNPAENEFIKCYIKQGQLAIEAKKTGHYSGKYSTNYSAVGNINAHVTVGQEIALVNLNAVYYLEFSE